MLFAKIKSSSYEEYEKEVENEIKKVLESRAFYDFDGDNPMCFGVKLPAFPSENCIEQLLLEAISKFVPNLLSVIVKATRENNKYCVDISGYLQNKYISFKHFF